jgi:hypothetical protein
VSATLLYVGRRANKKMANKKMARRLGKEVRNVRVVPANGRGAEGLVALVVRLLPTARGR